MVHVNVLQTHRVNVFQHLIGEQRLKGTVTDEVSDDDVTETLALSLGNGQPFVFQTEDVPHASLAPRTHREVLAQDRVTVDHLGQNPFEFVVRREVRRRRSLLEQDFNKFTADVFFFFRQLRFQADPEDLPGVFLVLCRFVDVNENGFLGDVNQVERTLLLCVAVKRPVVHGARPVPGFEITHPLCDVRVSRHDAGEIASGELELFVGHAHFLLSSPR